MNLIPAIFCFSFVFGLCLISSAQRGGRGNDVGFERSKPAVGDPLPDVSGFDADGNEFNLRQLKDNYSVVVFGCLT